MKLHTIAAALSEDKLLKFDGQPEINEGENQTTALEIRIPASLQDFHYYLEFLCPNGKKYITPRIEAENNVILYEIENSVLKSHGSVYTQLVARSRADDKIVFKSVKDLQASFWVNAGINAEYPVTSRRDFLSKAQETLNNISGAADTAQRLGSELQEKLTTLDGVLSEVQENLESGAFHGVDGLDGERGEKGDKGDKGERGERGLDGVLVPTNGAFGFIIEKGELILRYSGETAPQTHINGNGELIIELD